MSAEGSCTIPAGHGKALQLEMSGQIRIGLPEGPQVADLFAFAACDLTEFLSTAHTRSCLDRLCPRVGEAFFSCRRRPMLRIVEDTSPGVHDLLLSACDAARYRLLGHEGPHRSCAGNLIEALGELGLTPPHIPSPVNLFENATMAGDGTLAIVPPLAKKGDSITLQAVLDVVLVVSACPMDLVWTNGVDMQPKPVSVELFASR